MDHTRAAGHPVVMRNTLLRGNVDLVEPKVRWVHRKGPDGLAGREPLERRYLQLDHKQSTRFQVSGHVAEALDLLVLGGQVGDGVVHEIGQPEGALHSGRGEVTDRHRDILCIRLRSQAGDHGRRQLDPVHPDTPPAEWQSYPAGADAELEGGTTSCEIGQKAHDRVNNGWFENVRSEVVVLCYLPIEVVLFGHRKHSFTTLLTVTRPEVPDLRLDCLSCCRQRQHQYEPRSAVKAQLLLEPPSIRKVLRREMGIAMAMRVYGGSSYWAVTARRAPMRRGRRPVRPLVLGALLIFAGAVGPALVAVAQPAAASPVPTQELSWGSGSYGELGNGTTTAAQSIPASVSLPNGVSPTAIAGGGDTGYAIGSDGNHYAWGLGYYGELGNGTTTNAQTTPVTVSLPVTPTAIAGGADTGYAIGSDGNLYAWGAGANGELGNGTTTAIQTTPVRVSLPNGVTATAVGAGVDTGYAIGSDGNLYAWGAGGDGELGNGTTTSTQSTPVRVSLPVTPICNFF